jgi:hypothetical protein
MGMTQREAADVLGVDHRTIGHDLRRGEDSPPSIADLHSDGDDGGNAPPEPEPPPSPEEIEDPPRRLGRRELMRERQDGRTAAP